MSKFSNKRYSKVKEEKEIKITKSIMIKPSLFNRAENIHNNFSEIICDALEAYLDEIEKQQGIK